MRSSEREIQLLGLNCKHPLANNPVKGVDGPGGIQTRFSKHRGLLRLVTNAHKGQKRKAYEAFGLWKGLGNDK